MDKAALAVAILALAVAAASAIYTRSQAVSARRILQLEHGVRFELLKRRMGLIAVPGVPSSTPESFYVLHNIGKGTALHVQARTDDGGVYEYGTVGPGAFATDGARYAKPLQLVVTWQTSDGRRGKQRLKSPTAPRGVAERWRALRKRVRTVARTTVGWRKPDGPKAHDQP